MKDLDNIKIELDILNNQKSIHKESKVKLQSRLTTLMNFKENNDECIEKITNDLNKVIREKNKVINNKNSIRVVMILIVILTYIISTISTKVIPVNIGYANYLATGVIAVLCSFGYLHKLSDIKETMNVLNEYSKDYNNEIYKHETNNKNLNREIDLINNELYDIEESIDILNTKIESLDEDIEKIIGPQIPKELVDLEEGKARKLIRK